MRHRIGHACRGGVGTKDGGRVTSENPVVLSISHEVPPEQDRHWLIVVGRST